MRFPGLGLAREEGMIGDHIEFANGATNILQVEDHFACGVMMPDQ